MSGCGVTVKLPGGVQQTSLLAYRERVLPHLGESQRAVLEVVVDATGKGFDMTNMEIAQVLRWSINRVTPRVLELRERGLVVEHGRRACGVTGNLALAWRVKK